MVAMKLVSAGAMISTLALLVGCARDAGPCAAFDDEPAGAEVPVALRNGGAAPVYVLLADPCSVSVLSIRDPSGLAIEWRSDGWLVSCEALVAGEASCGGPICAGVALRIDPGATWIETWPGTVFESQTVATECAGEDPNGCGPGCAVIRTPSPGSWTFDVTVATEVTCGGGSCPCEETNTPGTCLVSEIEGAHEGDTAVRTSTLDYPTSTDVEFVL